MCFSDREWFQVAKLITNDHFWRKNRSRWSEFTILKISIYFHCISLVNWGSDSSDLDENPKNHKIQMWFATWISCSIPANCKPALSTINDSYKTNYMEKSDMSPWRYGPRKLSILPKSSKIINFCLFLSFSRKVPCWLNARNFVNISI